MGHFVGLSFHLIPGQASLSDATVHLGHGNVYLIVTALVYGYCLPCHVDVWEGLTDMTVMAMACFAGVCDAHLACPGHPLLRATSWG